MRLRLHQPARQAILLVLSTFQLLAVSTARAQEPVVQEPQTLVSGWYESPPLFEFGPNGELAGFGADLARLLARELGLPLEFRRATSLPEDIKAFADGKTNIIPGVPSRPLSLETNIQSRSVGVSRRRLIVRADKQERINLDAMPPPKVGYVAAGEKSARSLLPSHLPLTAFETPDEGLIALLSKNIDLWFATEEGSLGWAYNAGIDHMFVPYGEPYAQDIRVVGLHESRADLLDPINDAIDRLEESGELATLRRRYHVQLYEPAPEVLTVGITHFPPYQYVGEEGDFSGFSVEVFQDLAERAGLKFQMHEISEQELRQGLKQTNFDVVAQMGVLGKRRERVDFTLPINDISYSIFVEKKNVGKVTTLDDLAGQRVGVVSKSPAHLAAEAHGGLKLELVSSQQDLVRLLNDGRVSAVVEEMFSFKDRLATQNSSRDIEQVGEPVFIAKGAVALRFGLGEIRERLNSVIPGYLLSTEFDTLRRELKEGPIFWTERRQRFAIGGAALATVLLLVMGVVLVMSLRARRQAEMLTAETLDVSGRLSAVMSAARSGIVGFNAGGQVAFANPSARRMLGELETAVPYSWPKTVRFFDESSERLLAPEEGPDQRSVRGEELKGELVRMTDLKGGEPLHVRLSSSAIGAEMSSEISTVLVFDDVTEEERHREQAERSSKLGAIGQLTGGIAHDFNNLLAVILGNLELIKDEENKVEIDHMVDQAIVATLRGSDLTRNMLAFARKSKLSPEVIDLNRVVVEAKNWIVRTLPETIKVETSLLAGLWKVSADPNSTENALLNLIVNARDAMDGRGRLTIETANCRIDEAYIDTRDEELAPGRYVMLAVSDTGQGISTENLNHIFVPFYTTKSLSQGTGLGLSMVMGFMRQSGGTVQVYSEEGQGTTFKLYFPATDERALGELQTRLPTVKPGAGRRVLLAEDEAAVREVLENSLERAGYRVTATASGDEAFSRFKLDPTFDLLLTDIVMPGELQGTDLARSLRGLRPELPVIFMSGYANEATVHGNGLRPEDIRLMKPVQRADLLAAMSKAIS